MHILVKKMVEKGRRWGIEAYLSGNRKEEIVKLRRQDVSEELRRKSQLRVPEKMRARMKRSESKK